MLSINVHLGRGLACKPIGQDDDYRYDSTFHGLCKYVCGRAFGKGPVQNLYIFGDASTILETNSLVVSSSISTVHDALNSTEMTIHVPEISESAGSDSSSGV